MIQAKMRRNRPRSNLWLYLLLNVLVSAATTLAVLFIWDALRARDAQPPTLPVVASATGDPAAQPPATQPGPSAVIPTATLPPPDQPVIEIVSVVGAGDLDQEMVMLKRIGEGNLLMTGWQLVDGDGNTYTFPAEPELTLFKGGAVLIYTKPGDDTATEFYWDRDRPAYSGGETVRLLDSTGLQRAAYTLP